MNRRELLTLAAAVRLRFLSNMTRAMLETGLRRAGLQENFDKR